MSDTQATAPTSGQEEQTILVGVDGSESSIDALREAVRLAVALGTGIEAIAVWALPYSMYNAYYPHPNWSPEADARRTLEHAASTVFNDEPPSWLRTSVRNGSAAHVLIDASRGARMLVLGSRGHGGLIGLTLGSVSSACVAHAHCPVLIVRHEAEDVDKETMKAFAEVTDA
jgi:nucleotide-binding universal stress UspA family protein